MKNLSECKEYYKDLYMDCLEKDSFEKKVRRLEEIVGKLEDGGLPLEESLRLFEEGTALVRRCTETLDGAEQKITELLKTKE